MSVQDADGDRAGPIGRWLTLLVLLVFCGEVFSAVACLLLGARPLGLGAWTVFGVGAVLLGSAGTALLHWRVLDPSSRLAREEAALQQQAAATAELELALAGRIEQQRRLRHDIRGVLSPVLLIADRLLNHADPAVKRSGEIMVRTVERATVLLGDTSEAAANPPADP